ncbi:MAG: RICIN domain-containing protein [Methyloglobulus sp.]|nr:RICIN domain-containing protein [Methyloglobulus sp.]
MNINEPLVTPPNAADDVGLTFQNCFWASDLCLWKVDSELNQWYYDLSMHRLIHAPSGKCVTISGADIVLQPCVTVSRVKDLGRKLNQQWSIVEEHGGSAKWSIKSDTSGLCLEAKPGSWSFLPPLKPGGFGLPFRGQSTLSSNAMCFRQ